MPRLPLRPSAAVFPRRISHDAYGTIVTLALAHTLVLPHQVDNWKERLAGGEFDPDATEMLTVMQQQQERKQARQPDATPGPAPSPNPAAPSHARP